MGKAMRRAAVAAMGVTLAGCSLFPGDPGPPIGLAGTTDGLAVVVQVCGDDKFRELLVSEERDGAAGVVLWQITSRGLPTREFRIGSEPAGWSEVYESQERRLPDLIYVKLEYTGGFTSEAILRTRPSPGPGQVKYGGDVVSSKDFFGQLRSSQCSSMH
jgi:hypothetical protein